MMRSHNSPDGQSVVRHTIAAGIVALGLLVAVAAGEQMGAALVGIAIMVIGGVLFMWGEA